MRALQVLGLLGCFLFAPLQLALAQVAPQVAPEDEPIADVVPTAPAQVLGARAQASPASTASPQVLGAGAQRQSERQDAEEGSSSPVDAVNPWSIAETFEQDFMRHALGAGLLVALACSMLGIYVVLKRIVFVGVALAEVSSTGIAFALLLGLSPMAGAIGFMLLGVTLLSIRLSPRRVPHESFIGAVYSIAGALSVLFLARSASGETHMLKLLQGDVLTVSPQETWQMLAAFAVVAALHLLFAKEFLLVSFDRDAASTLGLRSGAWDYLLFLSIGLSIAFSIRAVGVLVTSTLLILPAVSALLVTNHLRRAWSVAALCGVMAVVAGLHFSFVWDLPASAVIVLFSFALLLLALAWSFIRHR